MLEGASWTFRARKSLRMEGAVDVSQGPDRGAAGGEGAEGPERRGSTSSSTIDRASSTSGLKYVMARGERVRTS
jgi:hypothetical protein